VAQNIYASGNIIYTLEAFGDPIVIDN